MSPGIWSAKLRDMRYEGFTPLHAAAMKGQIEIVTVLLSMKADTEARSASGGTPLHDAAFAGQADAARMLIEKGAKIDSVDAESGNTPLHHAASWGRKAVVVLLLEKGANRGLKNRAGKTAADLAKENSQDEVLGLLLDRAK